MWKIFAICVLTLLTTGPHVAGARLGQKNRIQTRETNNCAERKAAGTICESCELLATCVQFSNGWVNIPVESCDTQNGFYCNANLGKCSNSTGPCHPFGFEGNFPCTTQGIFPDPYDCQRYHMCYFVESTLVSASVDCGTDRAFNAASGQCSMTLQDTVCIEPQFKCENAGDAHAWPNNPNIFYVCKATSNQELRVLYPTLYRCDSGQSFNGFRCSSDALPDRTSTARPTVNTTTPNGNIPEGIKCSSSGLLPDPENCRKYFYCSGINGKVTHNECPKGTHYNILLSSCTLGAC